jgi:nucleoside-diphosphate-sugar epimerase
MLHNDGRVVLNFIVQALRGDPITIEGDGSQTRSFCCVDANRRSNPTDEHAGRGGGAGSLGNPVETTVRDLAQTYHRAQRVNLRLEVQSPAKRSHRRAQYHQLSLLGRSSTHPQTQQCSFSERYLTGAGAVDLTAPDVDNLRTRNMLYGII